MYFSSVILYGGVILLAALLSSLWQRQLDNNGIIKSITAGIILIVISLFSSIRSGIGTDYNMYVNIFHYIKDKGIDIKKAEPGYYLLNLLISKVGGNEHVLFFVVSLITLFFIILSLYEYKDKISLFFAMFIYMAWFFQLSFNLVRQSLALSIALFSLKYIFNKKLLKFTLTILFAACFHYSAILLFPFYFFYQILNNRNRAVISLIIYSAALFALFNIHDLIRILINHFDIFSKYEIYIGAGSNVKIGIIIWLIKLSIIIPLLLNYKKIIEYDKRNQLFLMFLILDFIFEWFVYFDKWLFRISLYFYVTQIISIPMFSRTFNKKERFLVNIALICLVIFSWYYQFVYHNDNGTMPFKNILNIGM